MLESLAIFTSARTALALCGRRRELGNPNGPHGLAHFGVLVFLLGSIRLRGSLLGYTVMALERVEHCLLVIGGIVEVVIG